MIVLVIRAAHSLIKNLFNDGRVCRKIICAREIIIIVFWSSGIHIDSLVRSAARSWLFHGWIQKDFNEVLVFNDVLLFLLSFWYFMSENARKIVESLPKSNYMKSEIRVHYRWFFNGMRRFFWWEVAWFFCWKYLFFGEVYRQKKFNVKILSFLFFRENWQAMLRVDANY